MGVGARRGSTAQPGAIVALDSHSRSEKLGESSWQRQAPTALLSAGYGMTAPLSRPWEGGPGNLQEEPHIHKRILSYTLPLTFYNNFGPNS